MKKHTEDLLFYNEYEQFYLMAEKSDAFKHFCEKAFGKDLSQDGFSDLSQVNRIIPYIPENAHILDIGCGNGKLLGYLQEKTNAYIHGFDYSRNAINTAKELYSKDSDFTTGCIGAIDYPEEKFDVIISMDTMYFAPDMSAFVDQIMKWLKKNGVFFVCYQEGDVMPKTENENTSVLAKIFREKNIKYECIDITKESYNLLLRKREAADAFKDVFFKEGNSEWYEMLVAQTDYAAKPYEEYKKEMARYIYVVQRKRHEN